MKKREGERDEIITHSVEILLTILRTKNVSHRNLCELGRDIAIENT